MVNHRVYRSVMRTCKLSSHLLTLLHHQHLIMDIIISPTTVTVPVDVAMPLQSATKPRSSTHLWNVTLLCDYLATSLMLTASMDAAASFTTATTRITMLPTV